MSDKPTKPEDLLSEADRRRLDHAARNPKHHEMFLRSQDFPAITDADAFEARLKADEQRPPPLDLGDNTIVLNPNGLK